MFHIGASFVSLAPIFYKSQSALILLLLLSKSQPLALGCDLVCRLTDGFDRPASFSSTHDIKSREIKRFRGFLQLFGEIYMDANRAFPANFGDFREY